MERVAVFATRFFVLKYGVMFMSWKSILVSATIAIAAIAVANRISFLKQIINPS